MVDLNSNGIIFLIDVAERILSKKVKAAIEEGENMKISTGGRKRTIKLVKTEAQSFFSHQNLLCIQRNLSLSDNKIIQLTTMIR